MDKESLHCQYSVIQGKPTFLNIIKSLIRLVSSHLVLHQHIIHKHSQISPLETAPFKHCKQQLYSSWLISEHQIQQNSLLWNDKSWYNAHHPWYPESESNVSLKSRLPSCLRADSVLHCRKHTVFARCSTSGLLLWSYFNYSACPSSNYLNFTYSSLVPWVRLLSHLTTAGFLSWKTPMS